MGNSSTQHSAFSHGTFSSKSNAIYAMVAIRAFNFSWAIEAQKECSNVCGLNAENVRKNLQKVLD